MLLLSYIVINIIIVDITIIIFIINIINKVDHAFVTCPKLKKFESKTGPVRVKYDKFKKYILGIFIEIY